VKSPRAIDLSGYLRTWLAAAPKAKGNIKLEVDVDPHSLSVGRVLICAPEHDALIK
jgi:hypothetical protein